MASYEDRIQRVLAHIHDNLAGDLSLDALAEVAAMSRFHWHRVFRAMTGETCAQAVRRLRLQRAATLLVGSDRPVAEIAALCGYASVASFTRSFAEGYGQPPAAFRARGTFAALNHLARNGAQKMKFPIEIETHPARRLAAVPHQGDYQRIGAAFEQLSALLTARGLWPQTQGFVGVYHDDPDATPEPELRSHAGAAILAGTPLEAPLEELPLPAGRYAVMKFKGPYSGLKGAYAWMYGEWLPNSGEEPGDHPPIEVYRNDPRDTAPEDLLTDVCVPLAG